MEITLNVVFPEVADAGPNRRGKCRSRVHDLFPDCVSLSYNLNLVAAKSSLQAGTERV